MNGLDLNKICLTMKSLRHEQGVTQEKVAKDLGCTVSFISNIENNRAKLNLRVLLYYSQLCDVSVDYLLNSGNTNNSMGKEQAIRIEELKSVFLRFSAEEQRKILKILKIWKEERGEA